jgi:hypothetical protein
MCPRFDVIVPPISVCSELSLAHCSPLLLLPAKPLRGLSVTSVESICTTKPILGLLIPSIQKIALQEMFSICEGIVGYLLPFTLLRLDLFFLKMLEQFEQKPKIPRGTNCMCT